MNFDEDDNRPLVINPLTNLDNPVNNPARHRGRGPADREGLRRMLQRSRRARKSCEFAAAVVASARVRARRARGATAPRSAKTDCIRDLGSPARPRRDTAHVAEWICLVTEWFGQRHDSVCLPMNSTLPIVRHGSAGWTASSTIWCSTTGICGEPGRASNVTQHAREREVAQDAKGRSSNRIIQGRPRRPENALLFDIGREPGH